MWDGEITLAGVIDSVDGYGHVNENIAIALYDLGYDVQCAYHPRTRTEFLDPIVKELVRQGVSKTTRVGMYSGQPPSFDTLTTKYRVGHSMFEATKLFRHWVPMIDAMDLNLVPSTYCKQIWADAGVSTPVEVNLLGVDPIRYTYKDRPNAFSDTYTFCISGCLRERKAYWLVPEAFLAAFPKTDDVRLIIKSSGNYPVPDKYNDSRIKVINESWPKRDMVKLLHNSDCFVYPSRAEGFGLSVLEAMCTGLPVIAPSETGMKDFVTKDYAFPLEIEGWEKAPSHWGDVGEITKPSKDHLIELMRYAYNNPIKADFIGQAAAIYVRQNLTWNHYIRRLHNILDKYL